MDEQTLRLALREAFDAGRERGNDEATSYDWGSSPSRTADAVFNDLFETWNTDAANICALLVALR